MKFAINKSPSGFRLSDVACREILERDPDVCLSDIPRNDRTLIAVIERLGHMANGAGANIQLVEVPNEMAMHDRAGIYERDGYEFVYDIYSVWGI